ncbi:patatin-like phospholipase family protein [Kitasatospora viridis]|uniref:Putative patatin/cPLA2 family phospholipase n=1 Tax=Kitasatospora viridis TaxID=281105 RepID=A0A561UQG9_9ACTN|nr:patatin-like phospholipase family protein [Kitasatospora viridis]TWG01606.1 putative patatin/cPLA2 family phospholipase [Kitasatospora viridis]
MNQQEANPHAVLAALADRLRSASRPGARTDGRRIALAVEGGGMRGAVSAGMALALHEAGLLPAFDAVYGASAGGITGAWLLSGEPELLRGWAEPAYARETIRLWNPWIGRPVVDVRRLIEHLYVNVAPMDFATVLANPITLHPLATDVLTGQAVDLRPYLTGPAELRLALRASAALPVLAGRPVELGGRRWFDAGLAESVPFRTALAQGATHVLVLRSRRPAPPPAAPSRGSRLIAGTALRRYPLPLRDSYLARGTNRHADDTFLGRPPAGPALLTIHPDADAPHVSRLARDGETLIRGFEAGRSAARQVLEAALV